MDLAGARYGDAGADRHADVGAPAPRTGWPGVVVLVVAVAAIVVVPRLGDARGAGKTIEMHGAWPDQSASGHGFRLPTDRIVLIGLEDDSGFHVFDGTTGDPIGGVDRGRPALSMLCVVADGTVTAHGTDDMKQRWSVDVAGAMYVIPGDDLLVVSTDKGLELWT